MFKDPFLILGVGENPTQAEVKEAYERLKSEYRAEIHLEGEGGKKAAKKLSELEEAYSSAMEKLSSGAEVKSSFDHVSSLLKSKRTDEAQAALDKISDRGAEWHYYQSAVYHSKGWFYEAKAQLEMAINMDPENQKYKDTMERMKKHDASSFGENSGAGSPPGDGASRAGYETYEEMNRGTRGASAGDCCASLLCADCCCECMGGDLIRCC